MINHIKNIVRKEVNKKTKSRSYRKKVTVDQSKINTVIIGKLSY